jgi:hypothetical protein
MLNIWMVVPCWKRPEITEIVFQEFRWVKKKADKHLSLNIVAVGDECNLKIARKHGFHAIESPNDFLGRKFNDGYEYAYNNGADYVIPVGSDSWIHPDVFIKTGIRLGDNYNPNTILYSTKHAMISEDGSQLGLIKKPPVNNEYNKCALLFYPRDLAKSSNFRPCNERQKKSCDRSTLENIIKRNKEVLFLYNKDFNPVQYLAFKSREVQIWEYEEYKDQFNKRIINPWEYLQEFYPKELLDYGRSYYEG